MPRYTISPNDGQFRLLWLDNVSSITVTEALSGAFLLLFFCRLVRAYCRVAGVVWMIIHLFPSL